VGGPIQSFRFAVCWTAGFPPGSGLETCPSVGELARSEVLAATWSMTAKTPGNYSRPVPYPLCSRFSLSVELEMKKGPCSGYAFIAVLWTVFCGISQRCHGAKPGSVSHGNNGRGQPPRLKNTQPRMERSILQAFCLAAAGSLEARNRVGADGGLQR